MKLNNIVKIVLAGSALSLLASCHNQEQIFPDYDGGITAYFAYQYPVRTIVLGESETFDTTLDNEGKFTIYGTMGGAYQGKDIVIDIEVDETLTDNLFFDAECTKPVKALPETHYNPIATQLNYGGSHMGGVEVQLTDAFFADPDAIRNTYVIPVKMTKIVKGADHILTGQPYVEIENEPVVKTDASLWRVQPKDYTLYAVKYINKWDGSWLRRGVDVISGQGAGTVVRHKQYVENDEVVFLTTESLNSVSFPMTTKVQVDYTALVDGGNGLTAGQSAAQTNVWDAQVWYNLAAPLKSGVNYTLKFMARATSNYDGGIWFQDSTNAEGQEYGPVCNYTTQWAEKTFVFQVTGSAKNKIVFNFGEFAGNLMFDNMTLTEEGSTTNLIVNGDFEDTAVGISNWQSYSTYQSKGPGVVEKPMTEVVEKTADIVLSVDSNNEITLSSATSGVTVSGTGKYVMDGEKMAWGNKDRDGIYLDYEVNFGEKVYAVKDTLVSRHREVILETFSPTYKK